jgi:hypothetical protein
MSHVWECSPFKGERLLLHLALADFANDEGECWPSQPTLAKKARCSVTWVRLGLRDLEREGLLEVLSAGSGRGHRTQYRLLRKGATVNGVSVKGETSTQERVHSDDDPSIYRNHQEPSLDLDSEFERFWKAYPRRVAKAAALNAFRLARRKKQLPAIDDLLAAVERYQRSVKDPQFICHPATWLRQQRWLDHVEETVSAPEPYDPWKGEKNNASGTICALARAGKTDEDILDFIHGRPTEVQEYLTNFLVEFRQHLATGR